jgi:hypothetical protein
MPAGAAAAPALALTVHVGARPALPPPPGLPNVSLATQ